MSHFKVDKLQNIDAGQLHGMSHVFSSRTETMRFTGKLMADKNENTLLGKIVFAATAIAMVYFFWWLLIYDHGVISVH